MLFCLCMKKLSLSVFENSVLKRIFGPKKEDVKTEWKKLYNRKLNDLYSSTNGILVIKSRRTK